MSSTDAKIRSPAVVDPLGENSPKRPLSRKSDLLFQANDGTDTLVLPSRRLYSDTKLINTPPIFSHGGLVRNSTP
jgi:hypothetical protein